MDTEQDQSWMQHMAQHAEYQSLLMASIDKSLATLRTVAVVLMLISVVSIVIALAGAASTL